MLYIILFQEDISFKDNSSLLQENKSSKGSHLSLLETRLSVGSRRSLLRDEAERASSDDQSLQRDEEQASLGSQLLQRGGEERASVQDEGVGVSAAGNQALQSDEEEKASLGNQSKNEGETASMDNQLLQNDAGEGPGVSVDGVSMGGQKDDPEAVSLTSMGSQLSERGSEAERAFMASQSLHEDKRETPVSSQSSHRDEADNASMGSRRSLHMQEVHVHTLFFSVSFCSFPCLLPYLFYYSM